MYTLVGMYFAHPFCVDAHHPRSYPRFAFKVTTLIILVENTSKLEHTSSIYLGILVILFSTTRKPANFVPPQRQILMTLIIPNYSISLRAMFRQDYAQRDIFMQKQKTTENYRPNAQTINSFCNIIFPFSNFKLHFISHFQFEFVQTHVSIDQNVCFSYTNMTVTKMRCKIFWVSSFFFSSSKVGFEIAFVIHRNQAMLIYMTSHN